MSQTNTTASIASSAGSEQALPFGTARRLDYIDGLRACACLAVFAHHCWMYSGQPQWRIPLPHGHALNVLRVCQFGNTGVHLFLLLSGYCLFRSYARPERWARFKTVNFARQRAWRILPAFYAACVLFLALPVLLIPLQGLARTGFHFAPVCGPLSIVLHALLLHGFYAPALYDLNGAFWSLSLEWQFYFTFPLLGLAFHRKGPWATLAMVGGVNLIYRCVVAHFLLSADTTANWAWCSIFAGRWLEFGLGMLAAWQAARQAEMPAKLLVKLGYGVIAGSCMLVGSQLAAFSPFSDIVWGLCYYCLLRSVLLPGSGLQCALSLRPLVWIGTISYSIYLVHMPMLGVITDLIRPAGGGRINIFTLAALGAIVVLPLAALSYRLFEQPFLNRGRASYEPGSSAADLAVAGARP